MKNWKEVTTTLRAEMNQWFTRQCRNPFASYYLYYLPAGPEHNSGLFICKEQPPNPDYKLAMPERINEGMTIDQNINNVLVMGILDRLPILDT